MTTKKIIPIVAKPAGNALGTVDINNCTLLSKLLVVLGILFITSIISFGIALCLVVVI